MKNSEKKYNRIVVGIDQSYKNTGITIAADGKIRRISSIELEKLSNNSLKRKNLSERLTRLLQRCKEKADSVIVIFERIRLISQGFLNVEYIKNIGALNAVIIDVCNEFEIEVFSVDTRAWKSQIIGNSKPLENDMGINPEKYRTILWVINQGFEDSILKEVSKKKTKGVFEKNGKRYTYNDDAADSAGIALYGFIDERKQKLKPERG